MTMNCQEAKILIDRRVQEMCERREPCRVGPSDPPVITAQGDVDPKAGHVPGESTGKRVGAEHPPYKTVGAPASVSETHVELLSAAERSALVKHLASCAACTADFEALQRTRWLLSQLKTDAPHQTEIDRMWSGIENAPMVAALATAAPLVKREFRIPRGFAAGLAMAACLGIAFVIGTESKSSWDKRSSIIDHLKDIATSSVFSNVDSSLPTQSVGRDNEEGGGLVGFDVSQPSNKRNLKRSAFAPAPGNGMARVEHDGNTGAALPPKVTSDTERSQLIFKDFNATAIAGSLPPPLPPPTSVMAVNDTRNKDSAPRPDNSGWPTLTFRGGPGDALSSGEGFVTYREGVGTGVLADRASTYAINVDTDAPTAVTTWAAPASAAGEVQDKGGVEPQPAQNPKPAVNPNIKLIKTGEIRVEVPSYVTAVEKVEAVVAKFGGFIADAKSSEETGGALVGRLVIRVSPENFEPMYSLLKGIGRLESEDAKTADVTAEYVDLEARIKGLQITEERLQDLVKNKSIVDKVSSLLEVERELTRVRSQIEQLQGSLRVMADRIGMSTIGLTLREPGRTVPGASLSVEISTLDESVAALGEVLAKSGGRLVSGETSKRNDGTLMGTYQLEVSLAKFASLLSAVESMGRVNERKVTDRQFKEMTEAWAADVKCKLALVLFERSRDLPAGSVRLEVESVEETTKQVEAAAATVGGSLVSNAATRRSDGGSTADIKLRVPAGKFVDMIEALELLGRVTAKNYTGETGKIEGGVAIVPVNVSLVLDERVRQVPSGDMAMEVSKFDDARKQLSAIIGAKSVQVQHSNSSQRPDGTWIATFRLGVKASDMEAIVSQLESLGRVAQRQISGLGLGDLSRVDPNAVGVIGVTLAEKSSVSPAPQESSDTFRRQIREGLRDLYRTTGVISRGLIVMTPWLFIIGLVWYMIARRRALKQRALAGVAK